MEPMSMFERISGQKSPAFLFLSLPKDASKARLYMKEFYTFLHCKSSSRHLHKGDCSCLCNIKVLRLGLQLHMNKWQSATYTSKKESSWVHPCCRCSF